MSTWLTGQQLIDGWGVEATRLARLLGEEPKKRLFAFDSHRRQRVAPGKLIPDDFFQRLRQRNPGLALLDLTPRTLQGLKNPEPGDWGSPEDGEGSRALHFFDADQYRDLLACLIKWLRAGRADATITEAPLSHSRPRNDPPASWDGMDERAGLLYIADEFRVAGLPKVFSTARAQYNAPVIYLDLTQSEVRDLLPTLHFPVRAAARTARRFELPLFWQEPRPEASPPETQTQPDANAFIFRQQASGLWEIGPQGQTAHYKNLRGFSYIRLLLERPGEDIPVTGLAAALQGSQGEGDSPSIDRDMPIRSYEAPLEVTDQKTISAATNRIKGIDLELLESLSRERRETLGEEKQKLQDYLGKTTNIQGQPRKSGGVENLRKRVQEAIALALRECPPAITSLLGITTGSQCRASINTKNIINITLR